MITIFLTADTFLVSSGTKGSSVGMFDACFEMLVHHKIHLSVKIMRVVGKLVPSILAGHLSFESLLPWCKLTFLCAGAYGFLIISAFYWQFVHAHFLSPSLTKLTCRAAVVGFNHAILHPSLGTKSLCFGTFRDVHKFSGDSQLKILRAVPWMRIGLTILWHFWAFFVWRRQDTKTFAVLGKLKWHWREALWMEIYYTGRKILLYWFLKGTVF